MKKNILVITYWSLADPLIQTYTLPYLRIIRDVLPEGSNLFLVTLEKENSSPKEKQIEPNIFQVSFASIPFGLKAALEWRKNISFLKRFSKENKIEFIHTWCSPGGAIGYLLSKKTGIPLILDSYEPHAEPMVETGTWKKGGIAFRVLFRLEKKQTHHAKYIIGVVKGMKEYARVKYGFTGSPFFTKPACVNLDQFNLSHRKNSVLMEKFDLNGKIVCVYVGKFGGLYLRDEVFSFFRKAYDRWGNKFCALLLTATPVDEIHAMCDKAGFPKENIRVAFVSHSEIQDYIGLADFAFSAFKPVPSRKYCTPIKDGEYWAMGLPVVIPEGISDDSEIIRSSQTGVVLKDLSEMEMEAAVKTMDRLLNENLTEKIYGLAAIHRNFKIAKEVYSKIYSS